MHAKQIAKKYVFLVTEKELQKCFIHNRGVSERNRFGQPVACEEIVRMLSMIGGENEVNGMTNIYNEYRT